MKKSVLLTGALLWMLFLAAMAQPPQPPSPEEMAKMETEQMKSGLNLTGDQLTRVEAINLKYAQKMGEMFQQGPPSDFAEMQKQMEEISNQKRVELAKILTPDQLKKYDAMMQERRQNMQGPPM